jgi:hypothetical protein
MRPWHDRTGRRVSGDPDSLGSSLELERLIGRALHELPPERAPRTLEARVLARIGHGGPLPVVHARFVQWPLAARALFVTTAGLCAGLASVCGPWLASHLLTAAGSAHARVPIGGLRASTVSLVELARLVCRVYSAVPREWLYGGLLAAGALYAALFGLAAAAYRALAAPATDQVHRQ